MFRESLSLLAAFSVFVASGSAGATDKSSISYYPVTGKTAAEVYADIKAHAPKIAANATFAFTMIGTKTDFKAKQATDGCRYSRFKTSAIYVFNLPQHSYPAALPAKTRGKWENFVNYLQTHEIGHRSMWQSCFAEYDKAVLKLMSKDCKSLDKERDKAFTTIKRQCVKQDEAYDVVFRKEVLREPFVAEALRKK